MVLTHFGLRVDAGRLPLSVDISCRQQLSRPCCVVEHVMKSLQSIESTDEKLTALCKKYAELLEEHRTSQSSLKQTQRTLSLVSTGSAKLPATSHSHYITSTTLWLLLGWLGSRVVIVLDSGAERPRFKSQPRRCRIIVLGKLFTPIVQNW